MNRNDTNYTNLHSDQEHRAQEPFRLSSVTSFPTLSGLIESGADIEYPVMEGDKEIMQIKEDVFKPNGTAEIQSGPDGPPTTRATATATDTDAYNLTADRNFPMEISGDNNDDRRLLDKLWNAHLRTGVGADGVEILTMNNEDDSDTKPEHGFKQTAKKATGCGHEQVRMAIVGTVSAQISNPDGNVFKEISNPDGNVFKENVFKENAGTNTSRKTDTGTNTSSKILSLIHI